MKEVNKYKVIFDLFGVTEKGLDMAMDVARREVAFTIEETHKNIIRKKYVEDYFLETKSTGWLPYYHEAEKTGWLGQKSDELFLKTMEEAYKGIMSGRNKFMEDFDFSEKASVRSYGRDTFRDLCKMLNEPDSKMSMKVEDVDFGIIHEEAGPFPKLPDDFKSMPAGLQNSKIVTVNKQVDAAIPRERINEVLHHLLQMTCDDSCPMKKQRGNGICCKEWNLLHGDK